MSSASEPFEPLIPLTGGPAVPPAALRLLLSLEGRGFAIRVDGQRLCVEPGSQLTAADRDGIRKFRPHLVAIVDYCDNVRVQ